jgi:hypothetical protein
VRAHRWLPIASQPVDDARRISLGHQVRDLGRRCPTKRALDEAGIDPDDHDELSVSGTVGQWSWEVIPRSRVDDRTYAAAIASAIVTRQRWRTEYEAAKARVGPAPPARSTDASRVGSFGSREQTEENRS